VVEVSLPHGTVLLVTHLMYDTRQLRDFEKPCDPAETCDPPTSGSDPYCVFILGDEEVKSKVCEGTNSPVWDDLFHMGVPDSRYYLRVLLYDKGASYSTPRISQERQEHTLCGVHCCAHARVRVRYGHGACVCVQM
jgi:hypothetical protein